MISDVHRQLDAAIRVDWGPVGAGAIVPGCAVAAVVDVLSFSTALSVAVDRGIEVFPYRWRDGSAAAFAAERDAVLAVGRARSRRSTAGGVSGDQEHPPVSLSPASIRGAAGVERVVLPSPNGSTISAQLAEAGCTVIGVGLRNRAAAVRWLGAQRGRRIAVVAAGERWPDGSLRPAVEDLWGAGALVSGLLAAGWTGVSPEASAAAAAFDAITDVAAALRECASGRELAEIDFADDVRTAGELDDGRLVPVLEGESFRGR
ncbi:hypothetical protein GCM10009836_70330 [Pseudonocardia ailaonensis]|uniref:Probable 2-phosphosulfolactate phosphatase n=1 Tax=Pseudonocardia ailaonensis TaxID=367279 RepID=A0ABN2NP92_9PSEU